MGRYGFPQVNQMESGGHIAADFQVGHIWVLYFLNYLYSTVTVSITLSTCVITLAITKKNLHRKIVSHFLNIAKTHTAPPYPTQRERIHCI